jgi:RNA polymerase sigma factor (sigma-70 family)
LKIPLNHTSDEHSLIIRCIKGDEQARKALYMLYVEEMMILCLRYIADREDAREVLMDAFLKFFNSLKDFEYRGPGSVKAWLKKITVNYCLMFLRKRTMNFQALDDRDGYSEIASAGDVAGQMNVKDILKLIHELPPGCKTVFNLYVFEEMTHKDIAQELNITEGTSKSQLHLARKILKDKILVNT